MSARGGACCPLMVVDEAQTNDAASAAGVGSALDTGLGEISGDAAGALGLLVEPDADPTSGFSGPRHPDVNHTPATRAATTTAATTPIRDQFREVVCSMPIRCGVWCLSCSYWTWMSITSRVGPVRK